MNMWFVAALALLLGFIPCGIIALRGALLDRLVAFALAGLLSVLILLLLAQGTKRSSFDDLALALGLLSLPGTLIFARFLESGDPHGEPEEEEHAS